MNRTTSKLLVANTTATARWRSLALATLMAFMLGALLAVAAAWAQDGDNGPLRGPQGEAPERDAEILSREPLSDDSVQLVVSIAPEADTYIASARPNDNFGSEALFLGYNLTADNYGAQRMLLRFDVESAIPEGSIINDAQIRLRLIQSSPADDEPMPTVLRRLASPWNEETVTWNTEPTWTDVDDSTTVGSTPGWYDWEVTDVVANWVNQVVENNGVEIIGDEAVQQRERVFYSRDMTTDLYPRLVVDYTVIGDTEAPVVTVEDLPAYSPRSFTVSWSGEDPGGSGIAHYDVQYRENGGAWIGWQEVVSDTSAVFTGQNGNFYEFRARGMDNVGNLEPFGAAEAATTVDNRTPVAQVEPLPPATSEQSFTVSWTGDDMNGSGIQHFDVQYRHDGGPWLIWQEETTATSAVFTAADDVLYEDGLYEDGLYEFEARAVDNVGHVETFNQEPEAGILVTIEPPEFETIVFLPLILHDEAE